MNFILLILDTVKSGSVIEIKRLCKSMQICNVEVKFFLFFFCVVDADMNDKLI